MISADLRADIRRKFFGEHWKVGTIASTLGVHHETVARAIEVERFSSSRHGSRLSGLDEYKPFIQVKIASIYALHMMGDKRYSHELEQTARSNDPIVRSNTVIVLGMMEEPSAIKILKVMRADRSASVRVLACEALWRLGNSDGLPDLVLGSAAGVRFAYGQP